MVKFIKKSGHKLELLPLPEAGENSQCLACKEYFSAGVLRRCKYEKCLHICCFQCVESSKVGCRVCAKVKQSGSTNAVPSSVCKPLPPRTPRTQIVPNGPLESRSTPDKRTRRTLAVSPAISEFWNTPHQPAPHDQSPTQSDFWALPRPLVPRASTRSEFSMCLRPRTRRAASPAQSEFSMCLRSRTSLAASPAESELSLYRRPRRSYSRAQSPKFKKMSNSQEETRPYQRKSAIESLTSIQNQMNDSSSVKERKKPKRKLSDDSNTNTNNENSLPETVTLSFRVKNGPKPKVMGPQVLRCIHCNQTFSDKLLKKEHLQTFHQKERPHQCNSCSHRFISRSDLKRHLLTHTKEKPYTCPVCGNSYTRSYTLKLHHEKKHSSVL